MPLHGLLALIHWTSSPGHLKQAPCSLETNPRPQKPSLRITGVDARQCTSTAGAEQSRKRREGGRISHFQVAPVYGSVTEWRPPVQCLGHAVVGYTS
ncbi:hypothetical protein BO70DRAFT_92121 [Aspergillus heteromorphus CBS 117.55]|uniref:Uncharacterized protein n=1 Tax=Aspergillus heteromorphus CBS 117.55 TaxID=1448321 RepID=A0A317VRM8_9EURO|nr:uncharacterized protein BO70DRAFT_92121 [Aspergillus heteromorphus CBS 117.55]PWY76219.1 hypothetical protein BO70DRAFT_92121 [Aspergillus heteromorphus CBS 117.55]